MICQVLNGHMGSVPYDHLIPDKSSRLRRIVTCIGPNQKNQPNLDLYLVRRYNIFHFPTVVSYLCIGQNQKNQPILVLYMVRRSKIFVSDTTLQIITVSDDDCLLLGVPAANLRHHRRRRQRPLHPRPQEARPRPQGQLRKLGTAMRKRLSIDRTTSTELD